MDTINVLYNQVKAQTAGDMTGDIEQVEVQVKTWGKIIINNQYFMNI